MPSITLTIPDAKYAAFKAAFLLAAPVPLDMQNEPTMGDDAWIKAWLVERAKGPYREGLHLQRELNDPLVPDEEIIE